MAKCEGYCDLFEVVGSSYGTVESVLVGPFMCICYN